MNFKHCSFKLATLTKEFARIGYNGFLFPHSYSGDGLGATHLGLHLSTYAEKETHYIQYGPLLLFQFLDFYLVNIQKAK
jgi:hypothetical protein